MQTYNIVYKSIKQHHKMITKITENIKYVGCDDPELDLFESQYSLPEGMCYNSYVIIDKHPTILDTIDHRCEEEWLQKVESALDGQKPEYLIVHHMEPDHSAGIKALIEKYPEIKIVCSLAASKFLGQYNEDIDFTNRTIIVKENDTLSLGNHTLQFIAAPFIHWPEVIMTYVQEEQILFSADGFGKFGVYDADADDWACEARRYYFNICGKYGVQVSKVLDKVANLPGVKAIAPLHGPVLEGEKMKEALRLYHIWAHYEVETPGVFIAYASIHGGTKKAAEKMRDILLEKGCPKVSIADLAREDMAEAIEDAFRYGTLLCCASSYDADVFPPMHFFLHKLAMKAYQNRRIALLENGTWAPSAGKAMKALIAPMKNITLLEPVVTIKSRMHQTDIENMEKLADAILAE